MDVASKISLIFILGAFVILIPSLLYSNFTAAAIGLVIIGIGATIYLGVKSKVKWQVYAAVWAAIIIIVMVLMGYEGGIPFA